MNFRNFTQEYIAKQLEITQAGYSKIERDEVDLTLNKLTQIAKILNVDVADILGFDTNTLCFNTNANDNCVIYQNQSMNENNIKKILHV